MSWRLWAPPKRLVDRRQVGIGIALCLLVLFGTLGYSRFESSRYSLQSSYEMTQIQAQIFAAAGTSQNLQVLGPPPWVPPRWLSWTVYALSLPLLGWLAMRGMKPWYRGIKHRCWSCGYNLTASEAFKANHLFIRCPECGQKSMTKDPVFGLKHRA